MQSGLYERDGYFHARFVQMMPLRGFSQSFPWTQLSTWRESFCDKEFLYHLAMLPFVLFTDDPISGAQIYAVLLSVAVLIALYLVLRMNQVRFPLFFTALPLSMGYIFLTRLGMIRSHVLSMLLLTIGMHFLLQRRWRALFILGFVYAWSYTVPFVLLMTAAAFVIGQRIGGKEIDWHAPIWAGLGSVLGLVFHPYFPLTLETFLTYVQVFSNAVQGADVAELTLGSEVYRRPLQRFFTLNPVIMILMPVLIVVLIRYRHLLTTGSRGMISAAIFWFAMTMASPRFAEYSVLLLAAASALAVRDLLPEMEKEGRWLSRPRVRVYAALFAIYILGLYHVRSMFYFGTAQAVTPPRIFQGASAWMEKNLVPGETVINLYWDDFPDLFYDGHRQTYLWGLDPTYSLRDDPDRARLLAQFVRHKIPLDAHVLSDRFHSRYLVFRTFRAGRFPELRQLPFREVYRDDSAVIYALQ